MEIKINLYFTLRVHRDRQASYRFIKRNTYEYILYTFFKHYFFKT